MKNVILFFWVAFFLLSACGTVAPLSSMEASVNIRVECKDEPGVRRTVLQLLRQAKARDVRENKEPSYLEIQASYYVEDNSPSQLQEIANLLQMQSGVLFVEMLENHNVVKQVR
jgi:uncharacterized membrane protein YhiD involved in acid resistance